MNTKRNIYKDFEHPFAQFIRIIGKGKKFPGQYLIVHLYLKGNF